MSSYSTVIHLTNSALQTPGSDKYSNQATFGSDSPRFSIYNRYKKKEEDHTAGFNEGISMVNNSPKYSFGIKHKEFEGDRTPGPLCGSGTFGADSPRIAMHIKRDNRKVESTPGPLTYDDPTIKSSPAFSIKKREYPPSEGAFSPGPGKYAPDYNTVLPSARRIVIGGRYEKKNKDVTPGPYDVKYNDRKPGISFHSKGYEPKKLITPGPKYDTVKSLGEDGRKCSIRPRYNMKASYTAAPYQMLPETFGTGPKLSFRSRPKDSKHDVVPGPSYMPPAFGSDAPKVAFHCKPVNKKKDSSPGPNYMPPDETGNKYTIKGRVYPPNEGKIDGPGPGKYAADYDKVLPSSPKPTIHSSPKPRSKPWNNAGYVAAPPLPTGPMITIGRKDTTTLIPGCA